MKPKSSARQFLYRALKFAFISTVVFCLLLVFEFSWQSSVFASFIISVIFTLVYFLSHNKFRGYDTPELSSLETMATISCMLGYWIILFSFLALANPTSQLYSPGLLAIGVIALLVPTVGVLLFPFEEFRRAMNAKEKSADFLTGRNARYQIADNGHGGSTNVFVERKQGLGQAPPTTILGASTARGQEFPKPQIVSVVWYWNWANVLLFACGLLPPVIMGLLYGFLYGFRSVAEGFAIGAGFSACALFYVVWNR